MTVKSGSPSFRSGGFILYPSFLILLMAVLLLSGCGFHMRGPTNLPFDSLYVQAPVASQFAVQLKREVRGSSQTRIADNPKNAAATLQILNEAREKRILSLSVGGRVSEFELIYRVSYRLLDSKNIAMIPAGDIVIRRSFAFNDQQVLSKESEEALLYSDMQTDAVRQLVRRLRAPHPGASS